MSATVVYSRKRTGRKASNAENAFPRAKHVPYKASRLAQSDPLRDSSSRRRNRVLSGHLASASYNKAKLQRLLKPQQCRVTLPTPPASPGTSSVDVEMDVDLLEESTAESTQTASPQSTQSLQSQAETQPRTIPVQFPVTLPRPPQEPLSEEVIQAVNPDLQGIPPRYISQATEYMSLE